MTKESNILNLSFDHYKSEVLTTGFVLENGDVILAIPERKVPNGTKLA